MGRGQKLAPPPPPTHHTFVISRSYIFAHLRRSNLKLGNFTNGALSSGVDGFSVTDTCPKLTKPWKSLFKMLNPKAAFKSIKFTIK